MNTQIKKIGVIGSGFNLTMSVAILANTLKNFEIQITAIELADIPKAQLAQVCGPEFSPLCRILGVNEVEVMKQASGTFRLGDRYLLQDKADFFVPFAHLGLNPEQDDFEQGLFQIAKTQGALELNGYSFASLAALSGKFAIAGNDRPDLQKALEYGVQLDSKQYERFIKAKIPQSNVTWKSSASSQLKYNHDLQGNITGIQVDDDLIEVDFCVDTQGLLLANSHQQDRELSSQDIYFTEFTVPTTVLSQPYTQFINLSQGWLRVVRLRASSVVQIYTTEEPSDVNHWQQILTQQGFDIADTLSWHKVQAQPSLLPLQKNVLSLGSQLIQYGGMLVSELQMVQAALMQLLDVFPKLPVSEGLQDYYNQQWLEFVTEVNDYSQLHFEHYRQQHLIAKMDVFARLGRLSPLKTDVTTESQWYHLLVGFGIKPELNSVILSKFAEQKLIDNIHNVKQTIQKLVMGMPPQEAYLNRFYPVSSTASSELN